MELSRSTFFSQGMSEEESAVFKDRLRALLRKGKSDGIITAQEIEHALPNSIIDYEAFNEVISAFEDQGIKVLRNEAEMDELLDRLLASDAYSWMRKSALTERSFWIGAYNALSLVQLDENQLNRIALKTTGTLLQRRADNSLPTTELGALTIELEKRLNAKEQVVTPDSNLIEKIHIQLERIDEKYKSLSGRARSLLADVNSNLPNNFDNQSRPDGLDKRNAASKELYDQLAALRDCLSYLALLQTNHDIQSRFE